MPSRQKKVEAVCLVQNKKYTVKVQALHELRVACLGSPPIMYSKCTGITSKQGRKIWHNLLKYQPNMLQSICAKHLSKKISAKGNPRVPLRNPDFCYIQLVGDPSRRSKKIPVHQRIFFRPILNCELQDKFTALNNLNWKKFRPEANLLKKQTTKKIFCNAITNFNWHIKLAC